MTPSDQTVNEDDAILQRWVAVDHLLHLKGPIIIDNPDGFNEEKGSFVILTLFRFYLSIAKTINNKVQIYIS